MSKTIAANLQQLLAAGQSNYPEMIDKLIFVNAPGMFGAFWAIIRPMLNARTAAKVIVIGYNNDSELHRYIDPKELPVWLGGYRWDDLTAEFDPNSGRADIYVNARKTELRQVPLCAGEIGAWDIKIEGFDIILEISFVQKNGTKTILVDSKKTNQSIVGEYEAISDGVLEIKFDNTYSYMTGKTVPSKIGIKGKKE